MKYLLSLLTICINNVLAFDMYFDVDDRRISSFVERTVKPAIVNSVAKLERELGEMPSFKVAVFKDDEDYHQATGHRPPFDTYVGVAFSSELMGLILKEDVAKKFNATTHNFYTKVILHELLHILFMHHEIEFINACVSEGLTVSYANQWFSIHKKNDKRFLTNNIDLHEIYFASDSGYDFRRLVVDFLLNKDPKLLNEEILNIENHEFLKFYDEHLKLARKNEYPDYHSILVSYLKSLF